MKINSFEVENVKRIRAVAYEPTSNGLTVIGGKNSQGKTSVLDAIAWALGGAKYAPTAAQFDGSSLPPHIRIELDNGILVERKGKNSELSVTDPTGKRAGQKLLDSLIEQLALDLPKFMQASDKEKAETLLKVIGVGDQLNALDQQVASLYNQRHAFGQIMEQKKKYAEELPYYPDAPKEPVSTEELLQRNSEILAKNGENMLKRNQLKSLQDEKKHLMSMIETEQEKLKAIQDNLNRLNVLLGNTIEDIAFAEKTVAQLKDESSDAIQEEIHNIDMTNSKVRANQTKLQAKAEADGLQAEYDAYTEQINEVRQKRIDLLKGSKLPLPALGIEDGALTYRGRKWDSMSSSEQLIVACSIVRELNPQCQFVLMDKLEQLDIETLSEFDQWLQQEGLQVIGTRVSTGNECQIIIEDGLVKKNEEQFATPLKGWK